MHGYMSYISTQYYKYSVPSPLTDVVQSFCKIVLIKRNP